MFSRQLHLVLQSTAVPLHHALQPLRSSSSLDLRYSSQFPTLSFKLCCIIMFRIDRLVSLKPILLHNWRWIGSKIASLESLSTFSLVDDNLQLYVDDHLRHHHLRPHHRTQHPFFSLRDAFQQSEPWRRIFDIRSSPCSRNLRVVIICKFVLHFLSH